MLAQTETAEQFLDRGIMTIHTRWLLCPGDPRPADAERRFHGDSPQLRLPVVVPPRRHGHRPLTRAVCDSRTARPSSR